MEQEKTATKTAERPTPFFTQKKPEYELSNNNQLINNHPQLIQSNHQTATDINQLQLEKSKELVQKYLKNKLIISNHNHTSVPQTPLKQEQEINGNYHQATNGHNQQIAEPEISDSINYEEQLSQGDKLKKIQNLIGEMIKSKKDSSYQASSEGNLSELGKEVIIDEDSPHRNTKETGKEINGSQQNSIEIEKAKLALAVAQVIKQQLPNYPIENTICMLSRKSVIPKPALMQDQRENRQRSSRGIQQYDQSESSFGRTATIPTNTKRFTKEQHYPRQYSTPSIQTKMTRNSSRTSNGQRQVDPSSRLVAPSRLKVREQVEKEIAYVFVTRGYGLLMAKEHIKQEMDGNKYNSLLTSVIRGALRKLCDILTRNMGENIQVFDMKAEQLLRSPMVNCRKWLARSQQQTFFKIINIVYGMNNQPIYQDQVLALYEKIMKQLDKRSEYNQDKVVRKRRIQAISSRTLTVKPSAFQNVSNGAKLKSTNTPSSPSINLNLQFNNTKPLNNQQNAKAPVPPSIEKQIAELFTTFKSEDSVHLLLTKRHPKVSWDKSQIKRILEKLIKIGLKKILKFRQQYSEANEQMPALTLNEALVSKILSHPSAQQTRVALVQVLMQKVLSPENTQDLVNQINSCLIQLSRYS